jgi:hypothetical protein
MNAASSGSQILIDFFGPLRLTIDVVMLTWAGLLVTQTASTETWHTERVTTEGSTSTRTPVLRLTHVDVVPFRSRSCSERSDLQADLRQVFNMAVAASGMGQRALRALVADELTDTFTAGFIAYDPQGNVTVFQAEYSSRVKAAERHWRQWADEAISDNSSLEQSANGDNPFDREELRKRFGLKRFIKSWHNLIALAAAANPHLRLALFLERVLRLNRRADASRQSAAQRLLLARQLVVSAPDCPPGEVVLSSARVPRGPDVSRATGSEGPRGRQLALI